METKNYEGLLYRNIQGKTIALKQVWDFDGQLQQRDEGTCIWKMLVRVVQMLNHLESRMG